jgi:hypothetical protein
MIFSAIEIVLSCKVHDGAPGALGRSRRKVASLSASNSRPIVDLIWNARIAAARANTAEVVRLSRALAGMPPVEVSRRGC